MELLFLISVPLSITLKCSETRAY